MGTGFSAVCSSKRSVIISNSLKAVRHAPDVDNTPVRIPNKLHPCESRDSGIVENEIPHYLSFSRPDVNIEDEIYEDDDPNESDDNDDANNNTDFTENKPLRPHSCRLGNRGNTAKNRKNNDSYVEENRLVRLLRQRKSNANDDFPDDDTYDVDREDSFYQGYRNESENGDNKRKSAKSGKTDGRGSTRTISDLNSSSETDDWSESEFWTIPDETDTPTGPKNGSNRKGWVVDEDTIHHESSGSITPTSTRSGQTIDYYKIRMDDLVTAFLDALQDRHSKGQLTQREYQNVMRNLRYQLVEFVFTCITNDVTPRLEVTANTHAQTDANWSVQIQLKPSDEQILQASEKQLAQKLADKGTLITRDDIVHLLGDHLRTIEQLQHVRDNERLLNSESDGDQRHKPRNKSAPASKMNSKRKKTPESIKSDSSSRKHYTGTRKTNISYKSLKQTRTDIADSDSDSTIENRSDTDCVTPVSTPVIRKSTSLDERKLNKTIPPSVKSAKVDDEDNPVSEMASRIWKERHKLTNEDLKGLLTSAREQMSRHSNEEEENRERTEQSAGTDISQRVGPEKRKEVATLDREFVKEIRKRFERNAITKKDLEDLITNHMRKTGGLRVKPIQVCPAPLKHTRSLNDAVGDVRAESSANSNASRRSEPDMRKWKNELEDKDYLRQNGVPRIMTSKRRAGATQVHGLAPMEPLSEGAEEQQFITRVEEGEGKFSVKSRPDSGIAVSMSSGSYSSYSSSEATKETETDDIDEACLTEMPEMIDRVEKVKPESHSDIKSLVAAITKGLMTQHKKAHALYCWLTSIDLSKSPKGKHKSNAPASKTKQLAEKKLTYAQFYQELCRAAGIKCEKVEGYVKSQDYLPGNTVQSSKFQHTWCAVQLDGHYRLVDPYYGSKRDKENKREKFYMDHYFMTSPDNFLLSHYPKEKKWLLMNQTLSIEGFESAVKTWPAMFHFNIRPLSMKSVIRTYDGKLSITVLLRNVAVNPYLEYSGPGPELDAYSLKENIIEEIRDVENAETFHITLPQEGNYYFTLDAHVLEDELDVPVFQCRIEYVDELL